ncbi:hypothetical protein [Sporosarcina sp. ITBMC105]
MRNALHLVDGLIVTTDNSGGIGEKAEDVVNVPDEVTAYFATRVALLEQWAANAEPLAVLLHNFSGPASWKAYVNGVTQLFTDANCPVPTISGSTETNMELLQSAMAVTIIGKRKAEAEKVSEEVAEQNHQRTITENAIDLKDQECKDQQCRDQEILNKQKFNHYHDSQLEWYAYGKPLVGAAVLENQSEIASLRIIKEAMHRGFVQRMWPVGSSGILKEFRKLTNDPTIELQSTLDLHTSAGPSTTVIVGVPRTKRNQAQQHFNGALHKLHIR